MRSLTWHRPRRTGALALCVLVAGFTLLASAALRGQEQFRFYMLATDASGNFVTDLTAADVAMTENGQPAEVAGIERFSLPVRLTITIDNGPDSSNVLGNFRTGLTSFVEALPEDMQVTIVSTAPQPRTVLQPTTDRAQILQGIGRVANDSERARFSEALVEYAARVGKDKPDHIPVLLMLSTTGLEVSNVQDAAIASAIKTLIGRGAPVYVFKTVSQQNNTTALERLDTGRQKVIGEMASKATGGRYEGIRVPTRLHEALPELGQQLAVMHRAHTSQHLVTVTRPAGISGQLQNPAFGLTRDDLQGYVSIDGRVRAAMPPMAQ
jgi:hypothetical protein